MGLPSSGHCSSHRTSGFVIIYKWPLGQLMDYWMRKGVFKLPRILYIACEILWSTRNVHFQEMWNELQTVILILFFIMNTTLCGIKLHLHILDMAYVLSWGTLPDPRHAMHILNMIAVALINGKRQISFSQQEGDKLLLDPRWFPNFTRSPWQNAPFRPCSWQLHFRFQVQDPFLTVNCFLT